MRFGARIALVRGPIISSIASTSIWNVSRSTSTNAGTSPARTIGAMSVENVTADGDDLVAGFEAEQLDREIQRRRSGVAHHAAALAERARRRAASIARDVLADAQRRAARRAARRRPPRSRARRGRSRVLDPALRPNAHWVHSLSAGVGRLRPSGPKGDGPEGRGDDQPWIRSSSVCTTPFFGQSNFPGLVG